MTLVDDIKTWIKSKLGVTVTEIKGMNKTQLTILKGKNFQKRFMGEGKACAESINETYLKQIIKYPGLRLWQVKKGKQVVGIMGMAPKFEKKFHVFPKESYDGFSVRHPNFDGKKSENQISDLLILCSKEGPPGLGQALVLLASALSGSKGLFVQIGLQMVAVKVTRNKMTLVEKQSLGDLEGDTFLVERPLYSAAAFHIYRSLGFVPVSVHDNRGQPITSLYMYRDHRLTQQEWQAYKASRFAKSSKKSLRNRKKDAKQLEMLVWNEVEHQIRTNPVLPTELKEMKLAQKGQLGVINMNSAVTAKLARESGVSRKNLGTVVVPPSSMTGVKFQRQPEIIPDTFWNSLLPVADIREVDEKEEDGDLFLGPSVDRGDEGLVLSDLPELPLEQFEAEPPEQEVDLGWDELGRAVDYQSMEVPPPGTNMVAEDGPRIVFDPEDRDFVNEFSQDNSLVLPSDAPLVEVVPDRNLLDQAPAYTCSVCGSAFTRMWNRFRHQKTHLDPPKDFPCPNCVYQAWRKDDLIQHENRKHLGIRPYPCEYCPYAAGSLSDLYKHQERRHKVRNRRPRGKPATFQEL